jgi:hypothetical protein
MPLLHDAKELCETTIRHEMDVRYLRGGWGSTPAQCVGEALS